LLSFSLDEISSYCNFSNSNFRVTSSTIFNAFSISGCVLENKFAIELLPPIPKVLSSMLIGSRLAARRKSLLKLVK